MAANPQRLQERERYEISLLYEAPEGATLWPVILRFLRLLRLAFWRAFQHDAFAIAKASAYSSILTFFPALLVVGSLLANSRKTAAYLRDFNRLEAQTGSPEELYAAMLEIYPRRVNPGSLWGGAKKAKA